MALLSEEGAATSAIVDLARNAYVRVFLAVSVLSEQQAKDQGSNMTPKTCAHHSLFMCLDLDRAANTNIDISVPHAATAVIVMRGWFAACAGHGASLDIK